LGLLAAGLGVAAVPGLAISKNLHPGLVGVTLTGPQISRTIGLISRKRAALQPAAAARYDMLKKSATW
jgi:DNA-binding transcriptional LysR family regulator